MAGTLTDLRISPGTQDLPVFRYKSDGSVDQTFASNGGMVASFFSAPASSAAFSVLVRTNGSVVAAGQASQGNGLSQFAVARFTGSGQLGSSFGTNGLVRTSFGQMDSVAALAIQTDGKILAAGNSTSNSQFWPITTAVLARDTAQ